MGQATSPFLTDLYQLNMVEAYLAGGMTDTAVFEFFVRRLPETRNFLVAAGLEQVLGYLEDLRFAPDDIAWLASTGRFTPRLLDYLAGFRFEGDVHAVSEGTIVFPNEPILRVTAPLPVAQFVETRVAGFDVVVVEDACRGIDVDGSVAETRRMLAELGVPSVSVADLEANAARSRVLASARRR